MKIAIFGTGIMGGKMVERLLETEEDVMVYNRTVEKTAAFQQKGAKVASAAREAIDYADVLIVILSDATAIDEVLFESDPQLKNKTIIQMGTIAPAESMALQERIEQFGGEYMECPVLGSRKEIEEYRLILMVGSSPELFEEWESFLKLLGPKPTYIGDVGKAAALKLAVNQLIAAHAISFSLSLGLVQSNDVEVSTFMDILKQSSLYAPMFEKKLPNWINQDYDSPNFPTKHMLKDVDLIIADAKSHNIETDVIESIRDVIQEAIDLGLANQDYSSVFNIINNC